MAKKHRFPSRVVEGSIPQPKTGTITVTITGSSTDPSVQLSGSGEEWSAEEQVIQLKPEADSTAHYRLTLELDSSSSSTFSLVGAQIFLLSSNESTGKATIFVPALSNQIVLHLLNDIPHDQSEVTYQLFIGVHDGSGTHWPDPTISFEPEIETPPL